MASQRRRIAFCGATEGAGGGSLVLGTSEGDEEDGMAGMVPGAAWLRDEGVVEVVGGEGEGDRGSLDAAILRGGEDA